MSGPLGSAQWMYASGAEVTQQSLKFNDDESQYLSWTPAAAGNRKTWTWSGWVKRGNLGINSFIFGCGSSGSNFAFMGFSSDNTIDIRDYQGTYTYSSKTSQVFRDTSAFYNLVLVADMNNATSTDRIKLFVNGERVTSWSSAPSPTTKDLVTNSAIQHVIGSGYYNDGSGVNSYMDGYLSDVYFIDGQALAPTSFGEEKDGTWIPKSYSGGAYGTNGFHLDFNGNTNDASGNGNNWTANNISAHDYVPDSPTNNFATLNPLTRPVGAAAAFSTSNGNLNCGVQYVGPDSTIAMSSGKWYWEVMPISGTSSNNPRIGIVPSNHGTYSGTSVGDPVGTYGYASTGQKGSGGTYSSYGSSYTDNDVIGVALDMDAGTIAFYKNGTSQGTAYTGLTGEFLASVGTGAAITMALGFNFGQDSTFSGTRSAGGNQDANGIGDFAYAPPSGFLSLCSASLPTPTIIDGSEHFNTVLWSGDSVDNRDITGIGFDADLTWFKARSNTNSNGLFDTVRGNSNPNGLSSNSTSAEFDWTGIFKGHITDGFTVGTDSAVNQSGQTYVAWNWKAGGTAVSNTNGTITSQVSANTDAGFSIVSYTGNGTSGATIGHSLGVKPDMIIFKDRDSAQTWTTYHSSLGATKLIFLNRTDAFYTEPWLNNTEPTSSVITLSTYSDVNTSGDNYIAYCFANSDIIKAGSYVGNGSTDGPMVFAGGRPAWILVKRSSAVDHWFVWDSVRDSYNLSNSALSPSLITFPESSITGDEIDIVSNGFKLRTSNGIANASGNTYIYLAILETPLKFANAR